MWRVHGLSIGGKIRYKQRDDSRVKELRDPNDSVNTE